jgi:copper chaperone CopZ
VKAIIILLFFALLQLTGTAQTSKSVPAETAEFKVYGNCGMCKTRIEKALITDGVKSAKWDTETKLVKVIYDGKKIKEEKLHQLAAEVGHDTDLVKANDKTYNKLHSCCKYERNEMSVNQQIPVEKHKH